MAKMKLCFIVPTVLLLLFAATFMGYLQLASAGEGTITAYGWSCLDRYFTRGPVELTIPDGEITLVKEDRSVDFMSGGDFVASTWYTVEHGSNSRLFAVDCLTGAYTAIGSTGISELTSFTYDVTTKTAYVADVNKLYTIDLATAQVAEVGVISPGVIIGLAADGKGNLYALDNYDKEGNDQLYSVDKETGAGTAIGPIGFDANYAQDIAFNRVNGKLYGALYSNSEKGGLYEIDTATGEAALLKEYEAEIAALAIPYLDVKYTVTADANFSAGGTVTGSGEYSGGAPVTLSAVAAAGYEFVNWTEEGVEVGTEPHYKLALLENRNLTANFRMLVSGVSLNRSSLTLSLGGAPFQLVATIFPEEAINKNILWSSSDESVATVDTDGLVSAVGAGQVGITATAEDGGFTATCTVTVTVPVSGVSLDQSSLTLPAGGAPFQLVATINPQGAVSSILWSSSDESVATVDADGLVSAVGVGQAVITVTAEDGGFTDACTVTVTVPMSEIVLNRSSLSLTKGAPFQLVATINPQGAVGNILWSSSDQSVAAVYPGGMVSAVGAGEALITAATEDGNLTATCAVTVTIAVNGVVLNQSSLSLPAGGDPFQLVATAVPDGASNKTVFWSSSDQSVATVDADGLVGAVAVGQAVITATTEDGNFAAICTVSVTVPAGGFSLSQSSLSLPPGGDPFQLAAIFEPADVTNRAVFWSSSDQSVATVDADGLVSAVGPGQAVITAATEDGGFTAQCMVTVILPEEPPATEPKGKKPAVERKKELPRTGADFYLYILPALALLLVTGGCICLRRQKESEALSK